VTLPAWVASRGAIVVAFPEALEVETEPKVLPPAACRLGVRKVRLTNIVKTLFKMNYLS
jgi:hypothetical protein